MMTIRQAEKRMDKLAESYHQEFFSEGDPASQSLNSMTRFVLEFKDLQIFVLGKRLKAALKKLNRQ
jgi:hypothetical protein